jgi:hypothetical protein
MPGRGLGKLTVRQNLVSSLCILPTLPKLDKPSATLIQTLSRVRTLVSAVVPKMQECIRGHEDRKDKITR